MASPAPAVWWHAEGIVAVRLTGELDEAAVDAVALQLANLVAKEKPRGALFDATAVTNVNPKVTTSGRALLGVLLKRGCAKGVWVSSSPLVRMLFSSVAVSVGMSIKFVETWEQAPRDLSDMLAKSSR